MSKAPSPHEIFEFAIRVAWHVCSREMDADSRNFFLLWMISTTSDVLSDLVRGDLTLEDSPADSRGRDAEYIERLRQRTDEPSKHLLKRIERDGIEKVFDVEGCFRRMVANDRHLAKCVMKSEFRDMNVPKEWIESWGLDKFLD